MYGRGPPGEARTTAGSDRQYPVRRRGGQVGVGDAVAQLLERAHGRRLLGGRDDDRDEMAVGRVAEVTSPHELLGEEARDVVPRGEGDRAGIGLEGLDDHAPRRVAAAAARELGGQGE